MEGSRKRGGKGEREREREGERERERGREGEKGREREGERERERETRERIRYLTMNSQGQHIDSKPDCSRRCISLIDSRKEGKG